MNPGVLSFYTGKRVLITGASGYLATNLAQQLEDHHCQLVRLSRRSCEVESRKATAQNTWMQGDINLRSTWVQALEGVDVVFHLAAQTSVYFANENPLGDLSINVVPMLHLLETCKEIGRRPIAVFAGTATEVGIPERLPVNETFTDKPITIYDWHKLMAEIYLRHFAQEGIVFGATLRLANVYGPGPRSSSDDRGILNLMIRRAIQGKTLSIYDPGTHLRDYIYVDDVVCALLEVPPHIGQTNARHFFIGSGKGYTIAEAVKLVGERVGLRLGRQVRVEHVKPPTPQSPIEARNFIADTQLFTRITGWKANVALTDGIDRTIESFLREKQESQ